MKFTNNKNIKTTIIMTCILLFFSCNNSSLMKSSKSSVYKLYTVIEYNREEELLLKLTDSSYVFRAKYMALEIGKWKRHKDSLFLFPYVYVYDDYSGCEKYNGVPHEYSISDNLENYYIPYRLYLPCGKDMIKDYTLEHHHLIDKGIWYIIEAFPLQDKKIKTSKKEKQIMNARRLYGGNFFDR